MLDLKKHKIKGWGYCLYIFLQKQPSSCNFSLSLAVIPPKPRSKHLTHQEYNQCVNQYADNVYRFIMKNLGHEEDAKDVVQSSFEKLWINREQVDAARCKSYLFTVAYHQMIDHIRKNKKVHLKDEFRDDIKMQDTPVNNAKEILQDALGRLNETQRSLVMLKDYEGYSYEEIGRITGLNESQVKVYLHRARIQLKAYIVKMENVI